MGVSAGVKGTPTVFVNNQVVSNVYDYPAFKAVLDAALSQ
jgi:protein-disulfide isomerase